MLSLFKKRKSREPNHLDGLYCDMHSHLIPGIDDGAEDLESSLYLIKEMMDLGYKKIITTPHIMWDIYKNTHEIIQSGCELVRKKLAEKNMVVDFQAAAEYYLDEHFEDLLKTDAPLLTLKDKMVLIEFSFLSQPVDLKKIIFAMQLRDYTPVIAHPERYMYFQHHRGWYDEMKDLGCLFQLNLLSLGGFYGRAPMEIAQYLIRKKYISFLGTDLHHSRHAKLLKSSSAPLTDTVSRLLDSGLILNPQL
jgi:protein-tyrosine phosphatase